MKIFKGKLRLHISEGSPYFHTDYKHLHRVLFYNQKSAWNISLWIEHPDSKRGIYSDRAVALLGRIFKGCEIDIENHSLVYNGHVYNLSQMPWLFDKHYEWRPTYIDPNIMYDKLSKKYYGFTDDGELQGFGIGDVLFDVIEYPTLVYCSDYKYRCMMLDALIDAHKSADISEFDRLLSEGIRAVVPYQNHGHQVCKIADDCMQAAKNWIKAKSK